MEYKIIYKTEDLLKGEPEYAIRYTPDAKEVYAKIKGGKEFKTDFQENATAYDISRTGKPITKEEYDAF